MRVYRSFDEFNRAEINQHLERLDDLIARLNANEVPELSVDAWIREHLPEAILYSGLEALFVPLWEGTHGAVPSVRDVNRVDSVSILDARRIPATGAIALYVQTRVNVRAYAYALVWPIEELARLPDVQEYLRKPSVAVEGQHIRFDVDANVILCLYLDESLGVSYAEAINVQSDYHALDASDDSSGIIADYHRGVASGR